MGIFSTIRDGWGAKNKLKVYSEGAAAVIVHPHPPNNEIIPLPYAAEFIDDVSGLSLMNVDGSTTPVVFSVKANGEYDIYIKTIVVQLGDNGTVTLNKFAALAALTNGLKFDYFSNETGSLEVDNIKTNIEFMKLATGKDDFGTGTDVFRADISGGGEDTYLPEIDLTLRFGLQWGLRLTKNTTARINFIVRDNLSTISTFKIKAYGIRI